MPQPRRSHLETILGSPWALFPQTLTRIVEWGRAETAVDPSAIVALNGMHDDRTRMGQVAIVPIYGVIEHHSDWMLELFGGTSVDSIRDALRAALADPDVKAIVLDVDSPGGSVMGITELAAEIREVRGGAKPIVAVANAFMASAAAWLGFQADEVVASPSAQVGSIGIYAVHQDLSRMLDEMGVTISLVSAGPHKTEGNEFEPLSEDARADLQERVDATYAQFLADVAAGRRVAVDQVRDEYGGGRLMTARKALGVGMIDRIETLAETVARLGRAGGRRRVMAAETHPVYVGMDGRAIVAKAIGPHETPISEESWDGPANEARLPSGEGAEAALREAHAWVDPEGDPETKGSYKFIHHEIAEDGSVGAANMTACSSAIGVLNGGRGGSSIPDEDREGVHRHLAGHMMDADREVPPLSGLPPFTERLTAFAIEASSLVHAAQHRARSRAAVHRPLFSTTTETALRASRDAIDALLSGEPGPDAVILPGEPAPSAPLPAGVPTPRRFQSRDDWLRFVTARSP